MDLCYSYRRRKCLLDSCVVHNDLFLFLFQTTFGRFKCLLCILGVILLNMYAEIFTKRETFILYWIC